MGIPQIAAEGMHRAEQRIERVAQRVANVSDEPPPVDLADFSGAIVEMLDAKNDYALQVQVAANADKVTGNLIDLFG